MTLGGMIPDIVLVLCSLCYRNVKDMRGHLGAHGVILPKVQVVCAFIHQ
jgi:hypothetical protein